MAEDSEIQRRERSLIEFPYNDLDDAVELARAVWRSGGESSESDRVAAKLNQTTTSGSFRMKVSTARHFGVIETERGGTFRLTDIGRSIVDPDQETEARTEAFLAVPLYAKIYEKFKGRLLPPPQGLEQEMAALGVSRKQTDKARQAFDRSARQAGFFDSGENRLVRPTHAGRSTLEAIPDDRPEFSRQEQATPPTRGALAADRHPLIEGLLQKLPVEGSDWSINDRLKWLRLAASAFDLLYEGEGEIRMQSS
ncbi:hypothetical protein BH09PSE2_BH09PSE2_19410 [soil metagenome]